MGNHCTEHEDLERLAFQVSPAPQVITNNRRMVNFNEAFLALFGYRRGDLLDQLILKLYPSQADYHAIGARSLSWLLNARNGAYSDERFMQHASGEVFWAHANGYTLTPRAFPTNGLAFRAHEG